MLRLRDIQRRFDCAAATFDDSDFVHEVTRDGLAARLEPLLLEPTTILDLGSATGATGRLLRKRFKRAHIVSLDLSQPMLKQGQRQKSWFSRASFVQGDASHLPFADSSFDMVVTNQLLPWAPELQPVLEEVARVLVPGGVFAFATLGPDSLREVAQAWASVDSGIHVNRFADMHDLGDGLVRAGLSDPVLDVDRLSVCYESADKLFADLTRAGARNALADRARGLTGRRSFAAMAAALADSQGKITLELELVYGHCWGAGPKNDPENYRIDANQIPRRR
ncbi:MAG: methyltransferase domain-containing protein [Gammaproteobacteria bacterium]|jgi:malonyl-CoA O-methyltransferase|nr:methyltransferase domain-containing protein [Gammaproteobacteria bacterium]